MRTFVEVLVKKGLEIIGRYYSCYRGYVIDNEDPDNMGRLRIYVPQISNNKNSPQWVIQKGNFSGSTREGNKYGSHILPLKGDLVWVEFEFGDPRYPVWSHGYTGKDEKPSEFNSPKKYGFKSPQGHLVIIKDDDEPTIEVIHKDGKSIVISKNDISFNDGNNGGLIKISELVQDLNDFKNSYNTHTHQTTATISASAVPGVISPTTSQATPTQRANIENKEVKH